MGNAILEAIHENGLTEEEWQRNLSCNRMVLNDLIASEDLANSLLLCIAGRDPKTELKEPTKSQ